MKRYKIDFNNGKVFESDAEGTLSTLFKVNGTLYGRIELEELGATITEIKEPIKFECDVEWVEWREGVQMIIYPTGQCHFHKLVGKKGRLVFTENEE